MQTLDITILCKVVDNFGDIGFVYRLARAISNLCNGESLPLASNVVVSTNSTTTFSATPSPRGNAPKTPLCSLNLRIVADNLKSFSLLEPKINPNLDAQKINGWQVFNWNADSVCLDEFRKNPPQIILECFQCGRPEWLENLLFTEKVPNIVNIIMIDYLTAEPYAETFHKLQSLTRSSRVQKVNFMPGFTEKTGGLILNRNSELGNRNVGLRIKNEEFGIRNGGFGINDVEPENLVLEHENLVIEDEKLVIEDETLVIEQRRNHRVSEPEIFNAIMFGYPRDYSPVVRSLAKFAKSLEDCGKHLNILLARGAGFDSFKKAYSYELGNRNEEIGIGNVNCQLKTQKAFLKKQKTFPFLLKELPFLPQSEWDSLLFDSPLLFVRGEDSLSRACLCGVPFVWHAYPQSEEYQLVKVNALLERMKPHFSSEDFCALQKCWQIYNADDVPPEEAENALDSFLEKYDSLCAGFKLFAESLEKNGDFAEHLLDFVFEILQA